MRERISGIALAYKREKQFQQRTLSLLKKKRKIEHFKAQKQLKTH